MKGLFYDNKTKEAYYSENFAKPIPKKGECLIKITMAAVCNTDKEILKGYKPNFTGIMGHEFVGVVEQSEVAALIGRRVVGELNEGCGQCLYCLSGREHHCDNRKVIGITGRDGAFAEYMTIATRLLHLVPENLPAEKAIYTEPLAAALRIPELVHLLPDKNAAVIGDGRLSYMIAQVLALSGIDVTVIGRHKEKLEKFKAFAKTTTSHKNTYELVIDAAGGPSGLLTAQALVRRQGTIVLKSTYEGNIQIDMSRFVVNEVNVIGSRCGPFAPALRLLERGLIDLPDISLYSLDKWQQAFDDKDAFKAGFKF